ncbi:hypothetical protein [Legionella sp. CNM-4043-24]|uniref:hypothetical protein n=1 Tax=Legionella sp. CNM-4043-24 TaxID=3421646 RepID=UPI00403A8B15
MKKYLLILGLLSAGNACSSPWVFDIAPYLWATSLNGDVSRGHKNLHVSESFIDLLKYLDFGGMLWLDAHKDRVGFYFDGFYTKLSDSGEVRSTAVSAVSKMTIDSAGVTYRVYGELGVGLSIEPFIGARYTATNTSVDVSFFGVGLKEHWTDALIGSRVNYSFNPAFNVEGRADYGQGDRSNSYNLSLLGGYQSPNHFKRTRFFLGYRFLHQNYGHGEGTDLYRWKMNIYGPVAGFRVRF